MLHITIPAIDELWDESKMEFVSSKEQKLTLEHSLISLSKWESRWCKPFLTRETKTIEETIDYVRCMTLTQNVDPNVYNYLTNENVAEVQAYINHPMTATWFSENEKKSTNQEQFTAEILYYQMIALNIPFECQKWHLNRLLTLIKVCDVKNRPQTKMSIKEIMDRNRALNEKRKKQLHTKG